MKTYRLTFEKQALVDYFLTSDAVNQRLILALGPPKAINIRQLVCFMRALFRLPPNTSSVTSRIARLISLFENVEIRTTFAAFIMRSIIEAPPKALEYFEYVACQLEVGASRAEIGRTREFALMVRACDSHEFDESLTNWFKDDEWNSRRMIAVMDTARFHYHTLAHRNEMAQKQLDLLLETFS